MKLTKLVVVAAVAVTAAGTLAACGSGSDDSGGSGPVTVRFQSLAFQDTTVAATKKIVADWNAANPNIKVELVQGNWDGVHDQLVTQFQGGTAPDIIHDESADIGGFSQQGYLADLTPYLSSDVKSSVPEGVWKTVSGDGKIFAAPTLLQSYVVFANTDLLKADGITVPAGKTLTWDEFGSMAKQATKGGKFGVGWGLKSPTASIMNLALNFDGKFFDGTGQDAKITVGDNENQVLRRIHAMAYEDRSLDTSTLTQSGTDILPSFYAGKFAMTVQGNYAAQQVLESAPKSFHWTVLPPLTGTSSNQAANPQTLSVSAASKHVKEATQFINFFMQADNLAAVGKGDWLIPSSAAARDAILKSTGGADGWTQTLAGATTLVQAPFQAVTNYPRWKDQIATPAFQQYLGNKISLEDLDKQLTDGWSKVNQ
jgi:multiple sugar transport system substrate-binding protein